MSGTPPIPVGVRLPMATTQLTPDALLATCRAALDLGFSSFWIAEHLLIPEEIHSRYPYSADGSAPIGGNGKYLDPLMVMNWLGAQLPTARFGSGILIMPLRRPAVLAKQIATTSWMLRRPLDIGIGTGWMREEYDAVGATFEHRATRAKRELAEIKQLLQTGHRDYTVRGADDAPIELSFSQEPTPPSPVNFLYGGHSPLALRLVASSFDGWYPSKRTPEQLETHLGELRDACDAVGKDASGLRMVVKTGPGPDPAAGAVNRDSLAAYAELGFHEAVMEMPFEFTGVDDAVRILERVAARSW